MVSHKKRPCRHRRFGIATVEFALVAPVLIVLVLGMLEMARGMMVKGYLSDAARRSCRNAILPTGSNAGITTDVSKVLADHNIDAKYASVVVQVNDKTADAGTAVQYDKISIKVSVPVSQVAWLTPLFLKGSNIESETVVMMRQR